ncbi:MAG: hypothetical protein H0U73_13400, partial [Tatlockia sp.]|nr:hypothetical protein [Tatlockia sp.]
MRNLISGDFELTPERWILSILRRKNGDHAFLILEGLDSENKRVISRAELGYRKDEKSADLSDRSHYQIYFTPQVNVELLRKTAEAKTFCYQSFSINTKQKDEFLATVQREVKSSAEQKLPYVTFGNQHALAGGFFGSSVERVGGQSKKQASIEANHSSLGHNNSVPFLHETIDASLQRGHSCVSWASEKMQQFCPDYNPSLSSQLFITVPQIELPEEENNT